MTTIARLTGQLKTFGMQCGSNGYFNPCVFLSRTEIKSPLDLTARSASSIEAAIETFKFTYEELAAGQSERRANYSGGPLIRTSKTLAMTSKSESLCRSKCASKPMKLQQRCQQLCGDKIHYQGHTAQCDKTDRPLRFGLTGATLRRLLGERIRDSASRGVSETAPGQQQARKESLTIYYPLFAF